MENRIKNDKRNPGVLIELHKQDLPIDLLQLINIGMILCASKDDEVVEYAMSRTISLMMVAEYKLQLPDKSILQKKLQELINMPLLEE